MENETDQNLGYAGFFFKKILQPHSLRNESFKQAADFKDKNLIFYVNQKFKEIRQRIGTDNLPKTMFLQSILKTKSTKTDIHKILAQENIETRNEKQQKTNENLNKNKEIMISKRYEPTMNSVNRHIMVKLNDRKQKELFVYESEGIPKKTSKKIYESNPDRKVRAILHENISENALKETLSEFNKLRLKTKFQRLKNDKNFEKIDFNKKFRVINQIIHNEDDEIDNNYFMTEICQKNKIDLSSLMHIAPDKLKMLEETVEVARQLEISDSSLISSASKKKKPEQKSKFHHQKLSVNEIEEIIQKEEDNQEKNLIDIFKKTHEDPDEYRKAASNATTNKKLNFQDQLFQKMDDNNKLEFMKILKKKNEFNEQKFVRSKKTFQSSKKIDQVLYFEKLALPKSHQPSLRRRISNTVPNITSSIHLITSPNHRHFLTSPKEKPPSMLKSRFKSIGGNENLVKKLMQSPEISTKPKLSTLEDPYKEFTENLIRPNSSINPQIKRISRNIRPNSSTINTKMKFSFGDTANNEMMSPPNLTKERLSMIARSDTINLEENLAISGMSPKTRVSIFETYKPTITEKEKKAELTEKEKNERNFQNLLLRRREKKKMIGRFDKFFVKCDMEALLQGDETKNIDEDFKKFMREYEKMQYTANKNIERFNLYSSDSNFNQLRAQVKFKKKLIDYLLDRVADKQDLLSVYNKNVMMEDNINKNKNVIKDSKR